MPISVPYVVLLAKQREIEELKRLKMRTELVDALGRMIHVLQAERGASSIFLASSGNHFAEVRRQIIEESRSVEVQMHAAIETELINPAFTNAKIISLMAWALLGIDALPDLRQRVAGHALSGSESVTAFSRLIAGLIALIFEVADATIDPDISRLLVSLFNLIEAKESSGQERAIGALAFGSGTLNPGIQQRMLQLIEAQHGSLGVFLEFADPSIRTRWHEMDGAPYFTRLQQLRQVIRSSTPEQALDSTLSGDWFDCCSQRISHMWSIQCELVEAMQQRCDAQVEKAEGELLNSEGLLRSLREKAPARADAIDRFFDPDQAIAQSMHVGASDRVNPELGRSLIEMLQAQTQHLANIESELVSTKRALDERKLIERAKGILMARYQLSEHEAHKKLRGMAMDKNLRLVQVAESLLALASLP